MIKKFDNFGNYVEVQLKKDTNPQDFLNEIVNSIAIKKFEIVEPSLNDIFIESVSNSKIGDENE